MAGGLVVRLPKTLKIGYAVYKVRRVKDLRDKDGCPLWGQRKAEAAELLLDAVLTDGHPRMFETLLHEAIHEISDQYKVHLSEDNVGRLASGLTAFLQDNRLVKE